MKLVFICALTWLMLLGCSNIERNVDLTKKNLSIGRAVLEKEKTLIDSFLVRECPIQFNPKEGLWLTNDKSIFKKLDISAVLKDFYKGDLNKINQYRGGQYSYYSGLILKGGEDEIIIFGKRGSDFGGLYMANYNDTIGIYNEVKIAGVFGEYDVEEQYECEIANVDSVAVLKKIKIIDYVGEKMKCTIHVKYYSLSKGFKLVKEFQEGFREYEFLENGMLTAIKKD